PSNGPDRLMDDALGIDIGTTFSAAAISTAHATEVFSLGARSATIPSVVVVVREHGEVLVGEAAERPAFSEPARSAREVERRLGDPTPASPTRRSSSSAGTRRR
ncbi:MAG: Hsp70 family protein, partial [Ilumatobacteraceae bacterium]